MKRILLALLTILSLALGTSAHGDKKHVTGTVQKINADSIVVKSKDGSAIVIKLAASTVFIRRAGKEDKAAKAGDLAVGDLVVIHATPKDTGLEAAEVKFSSKADRGAPGTAANPK
jgi:hypothetical protein